MAKTPSAIISPALGPMMWMPRILSVSLSVINLSKQHKCVSNPLKKARIQPGSRNNLLDHSLGVQVGLCPRIGTEWERANVVCFASRLNLLLGLAYPSGLR